MTDLRGQSPETLRQLAAEAERRAWAGEAPAEIAAAIGCSLSTYRRWAALYGFRLADIGSGHGRARVGGKVSAARKKSVRSPARSGQSPDRSCGLDLDTEGLQTTKAILHAVRAALEAGDRSRADRLIAAWKVRARRARDLTALKAEAAEEDIKEQNAAISDDDLIAEVSALIGRKVTLRD